MKLPVPQLNASTNNVGKWLEKFEREAYNMKFSEEEKLGHLAMSTVFPDPFVLYELQLAYATAILSNKGKSYQLLLCEMSIAHISQSRGAMQQEHPIIWTSDYSHLNVHGFLDEQSRDRELRDDQGHLGTRVGGAEREDPREEAA